MGLDQIMHRRWIKRLDKQVKRKCTNYSTEKKEWNIREGDL